MLMNIVINLWVECNLVQERGVLK